MGVWAGADGDDVSIDSKLSMVLMVMTITIIIIMTMIGMILMANIANVDGDDSSRHCGCDVVLAIAMANLVMALK